MWEFSITLTLFLLSLSALPVLFLSFIGEFCFYITNNNIQVVLNF